MSKHYHRFIDEDLDWLVEVPPEEEKQKEFDEAKHPRGEAGRFTDAGGGEGGGKEDTSSGSGKIGGGQVKTPGDFAKDGIGLYPEITSDMKTQNTFFDMWNKRIDKPPAKFKEEFFSKALKGTMRLDYQNREKSLQVLTTPKTDDGHAMGDIRATIFFDQRRVHMDYYELGGEFQGKGIMKDVMRSEMKMWNEMGIKKIDLYANINVGGHAWAKYGFVPTPDAWYSLSRDIGSKIDRMSSGDGGEGYDDASSWDELSSQRQGRIEQSYDMQTRDEFLQSEIEHWRDSGQPLEEAKIDIVGQFESGSETAWVSDAVEGYRLDRLEKGKPDIPFSDEDIVNAIKLKFDPTGYGGGGFHVEFKNAALKNPKDVDPAQLPLPGIKNPKPHDYLTDDMREGITKAVHSGFNTTADRVVDDIDPPDFTEAVRENQNDNWDSMDASERFRWAENNASDLLTGVTQKGTGEMSEEDAARLQKVLDTAGPKGIWVIADSKWGKDLLLQKNWDGELKLGDKQSMDRFYAYIGGKDKKN